MLDLKTTGKVMLKQNKEALKVAAGLEAGRIINHKLAALVKPKLPMMVRGYADTAIGEAVIANLAAVAIMQVATNNPKAIKAAELMVQAAAVETVESFDIEGMIDGLLEGIELPEFNKLTKTEEA